MKSNIRVAILGGSKYSAVGRAHVSALSMLSDVVITGGCFSRDITRNRDSADMYGIPEGNVYKDLDELIHRKSDYDIVVVLTPTDQHHSQIEKLLISGINVISEKSLDTNSSGAKKLAEKAMQNNAFLAVIFNYTGYPMLREIRSMVSRGLLGELVSINAEMPQEGFLRKDATGSPLIPQAWRLKDDEIPTVSLDLGVHLHSIISFVTKLKAQQVVSLQSQKGNFPEITDEVRAMVLYEGEVNASLWYSKTSLGNRNGLAIEIYGKRASVKWIQANPELVKYSKDTGEIIMLDQSHPICEEANKIRYSRFKVGHPAGFIEAMANHYEDIFTDFIHSNNSLRKTDRHLSFDAFDAATGLSLLEAIVKSHKNRKWVEIE